MKKYEYDISIIIPCYNCSKYVDETFKSLFNQTYSFDKMELIFLNDGSTDDTLEKTKRYERKNVIVISKNNEGVSSTRNLGIDLAKGKYILFLDPDDYLSKNSIEFIINFFDKNYNEIDLLTYPLVYLYPNGKIKEHNRYKNAYELGTAVYDLNKYYNLIQPTVNVCIKNNKKYKFDINQKYSEDEQLNTKIVMNKKKIGFVKEATYYYRRHDESVTSKRANIDLEKIYGFYDDLLYKYNNHPYVQASVINNLTWRIREECLFPNNLSKNKVAKYLVPIKNRLKNIDFSLFTEKVIDNKKNLLELLSLGEQSCNILLEDNKYKLLWKDKVLLDNIEHYNCIDFITYENNFIEFNGYLITPFYYYDDLKLFIKLTYYDGNEKIEEVLLTNEYDYQKKYKREYKISINPNEVCSISFYLQANNNNFNIDISPISWCSKSKVYKNKQIIIDKNIKICNKKNFDKIKNRFKYCKNKKFILINLLALITRIGRGYTIYFGDKNSDIYNEYLSSKIKKKKFFSNGLDNIYKVYIINCKQIITDKNVNLTIPFSGMRPKYIQASNFKVIKYNNK